VKKEILILFVIISSFSYSQEVLKLYYKDSIVEIDNILENFYSINKTDTVYGIKQKYFNADNCYKVYYDKEFRNLMYEFYCKDDSCYDICYYLDGKIKEKLVTRNGYAMLYVFTWCNNGQMISKWYEKDTLYSYKYCNGQLKKQYIIKYASYNGSYIEWYDNGVEKIVGEYLNNEKIGLWKYFDINGIIKKEEIWEEGKLIKQ